MSRLRRLYAVAVALETDPGVAETLSAGDLIPNCYDADIQPTIIAEQREGGGNSLSPRTTHMGARGASITFTVELTANDDPLWASRLLPPMGLGASSGVYTRDSRPPEISGSTAKTVTIGVYRAGKLKMARGCMGTGTFRFGSGGRMFLECEFTGIWVAPTNVATPSPALLTPIRFAGATITIGDFTPKISEFTLALNNEVVLREDPTDDSAYASALITAWQAGGTINPESTLTGTHGATILDPHADMVAQTLRALEVSVGSLSFASDTFQVVDAPEEERNNIVVDAISYELVRDEASGDDELSITTPTA